MRVQFDRGRRAAPPRHRSRKDFIIADDDLSETNDDHFEQSGRLLEGKVY